MRAEPKTQPLSASTWPWYVGGLIVGISLFWAMLHVARFGSTTSSPRLLRALFAVLAATLVTVAVAFFAETKRRGKQKLARMSESYGKIRAARTRPSVMQEDVGVDEDEPVPHNTVDDLAEESGDGHDSGGDDTASGTASGTAHGQQTDPSALLRIRRPQPSAQERMDEQHDLAASLLDEGSTMVGGVRSSSFSTRVMPRRVEAAREWLEADKRGEGTTDAKRANMLAEALTYEGLRRFEESTLFAKEAYKTHQYDEPGEGFVGNYVEPTLDGYDMAFKAYSDTPFVPRRERLSNNAPAHF